MNKPKTQTVSFDMETKTLSVNPEFLKTLKAGERKMLAFHEQVHLEAQRSRMTEKQYQDALEAIKRLEEEPAGESSPFQVGHRVCLSQAHEQKGTVVRPGPSRSYVLWDGGDSVVSIANDDIEVL